MAGVAAIAAILFGVLEVRRGHDEERRISEIQAQAKQYVRGNIHDVPSEDYLVSLKFGRSVLGATDVHQKQFSFAVFQDEAQEANIASLRLESYGDGRVISIGIPTSCITGAMGQAPLDWQLAEVAGGYEVRDRRSQMRSIGTWGTNKAPEPCVFAQTTSAPQFPRILSALIGEAHAQTANPIDDPSPEPPAIDLADIIADLNSDITEIRRSARDALSLAPAEQVPEILAAANVEGETYRTRLGVTVALTEMLRRDKSQREAIIPVLTDDDRHALLKLAADPDRTLRIYSTEFLFDLGDPAVTELAIPMAAETDDDVARYNWIFVAQDGWWRLDTDAKTALADDLTTVFDKSGSQTKALLQAFEN